MQDRVVFSSESDYLGVVIGERQRSRAREHAAASPYICHAILGNDIRAGYYEHSFSLFVSALTFLIECFGRIYQSSERILGTLMAIIENNQSTQSLGQSTQSMSRGVPSMTSTRVTEGVVRQGSREFRAHF